MKNPVPFFLGIFATCGSLILCQYVLNQEAKLRCMENGSPLRIVEGRTFMGDTTLCVHVAEVRIP
jgi:hypothetical protein